MTREKVEQPAKRREERRKGEDNVERDEWIDREKKLTQLIKATWMVKIKA